VIQENKRRAKKKSSSSRKKKISLAYILLTVIAVLLILLLSVVPRSIVTGDEGEDLQVLQPEERKVQPEEKGVQREADGAEKEKQDQISENGVKESTETLVPEETATRAYLYLVLDDVGYNTGELESFLNLPFPITYSILPGIEKTEESYRKVLDSGREVMLHQPIEPLGNEDPGPKALYVTMSPDEIRSTIAGNLAQLPEAVGVNNHMGSKGTADLQLMQNMLYEMKISNRELFFLDSRTTSETVAEEIAESLNLFHSRRNVFLDNVDTADAIGGALEEAMQIADSRGYAVLIGHVWSRELAETLSSWYPEIRKRGYDFAFLSALFSEEVAHAGAGS